MAAIRSSARTVQQRFGGAVPKQQLRRLHITGSNARPSKLLASEPAIVQGARDTQQISESGTPASRHFNTSRSLKAVNDSSTIDFAYMPQFTLGQTSPPEIMRIPLLPDNYEPLRHSIAHQEAMEPVIRPTIETASADSSNVVSAMSEVTDNDSVEIDMFGEFWLQSSRHRPSSLTSSLISDLTKQVGKAAKGMMENNVENVKKSGGMMREVWSGFVDDLLGKKTAKA
ncbi:hypothetical protein MMC26_002718 [Xylographa opegraphella]|nr:hypothetical protein [Xylographa opegraphella]